MIDRHKQKQVEHIQQVMRDVHKILSGHPPGVQGAALADLLALYIAGHHPSIREDVLAFHIEIVRKLIPVNAKMIDNLMPDRWDKK